MEKENKEEVKQKLEFVEREDEILKQWEENQIFQKTLDARKGAPEFTFYEGPPTANNKPGVHHILARVYKDIFCRYKTMRGFLVERKAGWDTHGLPVELSIEKELGFKNKNDIEAFGVDKFNQMCKDSVWKYTKDWEKTTARIGYWLDMKNPYVTYDNKYIESSWWIIKQAFNKNLLYKGYKVIPFCPRCGTALSSHELAQGYKTVSDPSVFVKVVLKNSEEKLAIKDAKILMWTTTPWTLMANVALAINTNIKYYLFEVDSENIICHLDLTSVDFLKDQNVKKVKEIEASALVGLKYEPLFEDKDAYSQNKKIYEIVSADFVSSVDGTGVVHIAPAFGADDMELGTKENLAVILNVDDEGKMMDKENILKEVRGLFFKKADPIVFDNLKDRGLLLFGDLSGTEHEYPFCWRCQTPLIYKADDSWFIRMTQLKDDLWKNNETINWEPEYIKHGRFGEWIKELKDWALSRKRYWGTPLPIWICEKCGKMHAIGSQEELKKMGDGLNDTELPINTITSEIDLHKPYIDNFYIKCDACGMKMKRTQEVIDCWFDSGAMPYGQCHFPFAYDDGMGLKDLEYYTAKGFRFPAEFICEGIDQTRGWFYTLLAISTILGFGASYKNVISLGLILDEKGEKMSKSKGNVLDPNEIIEKYGSDSLRWYMFSASNPGDFKKFSLLDLSTSQRRFANTFWNVVKFYETYVLTNREVSIDEDNILNSLQKLSVLDRWILNKLIFAKQEYIKKLDSYDCYSVTKILDDLIDSFSRWYLRRSRKVFQANDDNAFLSEQVFGYVIKEITKMIAPFCPIFGEMIWKQCGFDKEVESVHLSTLNDIDWSVDNDLLLGMDKVRNLSAAILNERQMKAAKVRQPLCEVVLKNDPQITKELEEVLLDEVNIKSLRVEASLSKEVELNLELTGELINEGKYRELVRLIQGLRQELNYSPNDFVDLSITKAEENDFWNMVEKQIKTDVKINNFSFAKLNEFDMEKSVKNDLFDIQIQIKKII